MRDATHASEVLFIYGAWKLVEGDTSSGLVDHAAQVRPVSLLLEVEFASRL
jgi:hypothetical protein